MALEMIRVTEAAAIASARVMGRGDNDEADRYAVEAMRRTLDELAIDATIVIGEGERDQAPMLFIGERVGTPSAAEGDAPQIDIAVDPLEGTNLVSRGEANAVTVLAASERGGLLNAPDCYIEKLCVGPVAAGKVDITATPSQNLTWIAPTRRSRSASWTRSTCSTAAGHRPCASSEVHRRPAVAAEARQRRPRRPRRKRGAPMPR